MKTPTMMLFMQYAVKFQPTEIRARTVFSVYQIILAPFRYTLSVIVVFVYFCTIIVTAVSLHLTTLYSVAKRGKKETKQVIKKS